MPNVRNLKYKWVKQRINSWRCDFDQVDHFHNEADEYTFDYKEYHGVIQRHMELGHLCGYIGVLVDDLKLRGKIEIEEIKEHHLFPHGGCTTSFRGNGESFHKERHYFGFDCSHYGDWCLLPGLGTGQQYRNAGYVMWHVIRMAECLNELFKKTVEQIGITNGI